MSPRTSDDVVRSAEALRAKIADRLLYFDECGPGPVSRGEYLQDADEIIRIVREHDNPTRMGTAVEVLDPDHAGRRSEPPEQP